MFCPLTTTTGCHTITYLFGTLFLLNQFVQDAITPSGLFHWSMATLSRSISIHYFFYAIFHCSSVFSAAARSNYPSLAANSVFVLFLDALDILQGHGKSLCMHNALSKYHIVSQYGKHIESAANILLLAIYKVGCVFQICCLVVGAQLTLSFTFVIKQDTHHCQLMKKCNNFARQVYKFFISKSNQFFSL